MSQQPRVCPHCHAYSHAAKCCIPHSTHRISSLAATLSVVVLTASEFAGVLPERMFSSLFGGTVIFQLILDLLSFRKPR